MQQEKEPTDNQINYAQSLGIYIPFGITFDELSDLISNVENNDKLATDRHKSFAEFYGVRYTKNIGKKTYLIESSMKFSQITKKTTWPRGLSSVFIVL